MKIYITIIVAALWAAVFPMESWAFAAPGSNMQQDCGVCHMCSTPTKTNPCLKLCPRTHARDAGVRDNSPDVIVLDDLEAEYEPVIFSHRLHAEMTEMDRGCLDCHHYQEVGHITACKKCHPAHIAEENLSQPGLKGAYHRQCLGCHQEWSHETACDICHLKKGQQAVTPHPDMKMPGSRFSGLVEPDKKVWHSTYGGGTVVTLHHKNHTEKYGIDCASCHHAEGCGSCHAKEEQTTEVRHSEEALHGICNSCHEEMSCKQCHLKEEAPEFSHDRTGWPLKSYHARLTCKRCHGNPYHFVKPSSNCSACHMGWDVGTFDHSRTGFALNDSHKEISCEECHPGRLYAAAPACNACHDDDITYPASLPGEKLK